MGLLYTVPLYEPGAMLQSGRYVIKALISGSPTSRTRVYRAEQWAKDWRHPRRYRGVVVIKVMYPGAASSVALDFARGQAEYERLMLLEAATRHPRTPCALDLFIEHGCVHLVIENVAGSTLASLLTSREGWAPPWPERRACVMGLQLAELLRALHADPKRLIVRDLKPSNLIVSLSGDVTLIDYGISCLLRAGERVPDWLRGSYSRGYAALEQQIAAGYEDERTDLYALGAILRQIATTWNPRRSGETIFPAAAESSDELSPRFRSLLAALLEVPPGQRPSSADVVYQELQRCLTHA